MSQPKKTPIKLAEAVEEAAGLAVVAEVTAEDEAADSAEVEAAGSVVVAEVGLPNVLTLIQTMWPRKKEP
jgi:hypothetical protein